MPRRKQPERSSGRLLVASKTVAAAIGQTITRHPSIAGAAVVIVVTFAYVSMNALYQSGKHPSPWFDTRGEGARQLSMKPKTVPIPESRVTTFRIQQSDPQSTASIPRIRRPVHYNLVRDLQDAMRIAGAYSGESDGVMGPQTRKAIEDYQSATGLKVTGEPTDGLLVHVRLAGLKSVVTPKWRPTRTKEPVATSQIWSRSQERTAKPASEPKDPVGDLIVEIQTGLSNIAYSEVEVDGVVGQQTRTAISHFQKHYRLPITGEPDKLVRDKLREIGAL